MSPQDRKPLRGRIALVTGSATGIGSAIVMALCRQGACGIVNYLHSARAADRLSRQIRSAGGRCQAIRCDVTEERPVAAMIRKILREHGRLDILVNNVGPFLRKPVARTSAAEWRYILEANLTSAFILSRLALPAMTRRGWGRIVNIAAAGAERAHGPAGMAAYAAAKAGLVAFTKALARETASAGITVNAVCPGIIHQKSLSLEEACQLRTKDSPASKLAVPVGRPGTGEDIAATVCHLCLEHSSFTTGAVVTVSGGWNI